MRINFKRVRQTLRTFGVRQKVVAAALNVSESKVSRCLHEREPMSVEMLEAIRLQIEAKTGRPWTLDELVAAEPTAPLVVPEPAKAVAS
jgi:hypothetical protein